MIKKGILIAAVLILASGPAYGQLGGSFSAGPVKAKPQFSLLDPSRLHMTQSYSMWFSSSRAGSSNLAMYLNSIEYQISDPLKIRVDVGYLHRPGAILKNGTNGLEEGKIMPGLSISWRPSNSFMMRFDYRQTPLLGNQYNQDYYNGLWDDR